MPSLSPSNSLYLSDESTISRMTIMMTRIPLLLLLASFMAGPIHAQTFVDVSAVKDNTLYEDPDGNLSNGAGQHFFAGMTARSEIRRGLVAFDLSSVPAGVTVDSVQIHLQMNKSLGTTHHVHLHRVTRDWGEGSSDSGGQEGGGTTPEAGDATWLHAIQPGTPWTRQGGDFQSLESAAIPISTTGTAIWYSTSFLVDDVNHWLTTPAENFGWLVMGDELVDSSAMRFSSRENPTASHHPILRIYYSGTATFVEDSTQPRTFEVAPAWPNPFTSSVSLRITTDRNESVTVELVDLQGRAVSTASYRVSAGTATIRIDGADLLPGLYLARITGSAGTRSTPLVRIR